MKKESLTVMSGHVDTGLVLHHLDEKLGLTVISNVTDRIITNYKIGLIITYMEEVL